MNLGVYAPMRRLYHLLEFCRSERDWLIDTTMALVRLESPSVDKAAVDRCGAELSSRLTAAGGRVTRLPRADRGDHLLAEFGCGSSQVLLLGHFDTVWPVGQLERMPLKTAGGQLHGPGVFDMKAGIAIGMLAARALLETEVRASRRIVMLWSTDEELGSASSRQAIEEEAQRSEAVLVLEPSLPGGAVKTSRKGCGQYEIRARGIAAHAGVDPGKGASAIHEIAYQIERVSRLSELAPGLTVNVGTISGGSRPNVVAEEAHASVDVRAVTRNDMQLVDERIRRQELRDARVRLEISGGFERPPLERTSGVARLYDQARSVAGELGFALAEGATGGGSDGNFTAALGIPTLDGLGAVGDGAHALHEQVDIESLPVRAALVAGLLASL
jgi:glutamate carboxypeptidase